MTSQGSNEQTAGAQKKRGTSTKDEQTASREAGDVGGRTDHEESEANDVKEGEQVATKR